VVEPGNTYGWMQALMITMTVGTFLYYQFIVEQYFFFQLSVVSRSSTVLANVFQLMTGDTFRSGDSPKGIVTG
jgi:hypothetical protein